MIMSRSLLLLAAVILISASTVAASSSSLRSRRRLIGECQGCVKDADCQGVLLCYPADHPFVNAAGCTRVSRQAKSYCIPDPIISQQQQGSAAGTTTTTTTITTPKLARYMGNPPSRPLLQCQADCDSDNDCAAGLLCFRRNSGEPAPGCYFDGGQNGGMAIARNGDVCIEKSFTESPTFRPTLQPTWSPTKAPVTTTSGSTSTTTTTTTTLAPSPAPTITATTQSPRPETLATFIGNPPPRKLARCEADCDSDGDCQGDLICLTRRGGEEAPGCYFDATERGGIAIDQSQDVCVDRGSKTRLRLYWEEGYYWQERDYEQFYCLQRNDDELVTQRCGDSPRQVFEFDHLDNGEALIRADNNQCLSSRWFEDCNASSAVQRWNPNLGRWPEPNNSSSSGGSTTLFELSNALDGQNWCLSPHHHPRSGETVYMLNCKQERYFTSNAWQFWW